MSYRNNNQWPGRVVAFSSGGGTVRARIAASSRWHEGTHAEVMSAIVEERKTLAVSSYADWQRSTS